MKTGYHKCSTAGCMKTFCSGYKFCSDCRAKANKEEADAARLRLLIKRQGATFVLNALLDRLDESDLDDPTK